MLQQHIVVDKSAGVFDTRCRSAVLATPLDLYRLGGVYEGAVLSRKERCMTHLNPEPLQPVAQDVLSQECQEIHEAALVREWAIAL
jgi:hypothetical protein